MKKRLFVILLSLAGTICFSGSVVMAQHRHIDRGERREETSDRIAVTCGQMLVSVNEIFLSSEMTDTKELHEQNCAPIGGTSGATRVTSVMTIAI